MLNSLTSRLIALLTGCAALIIGGGMWLDYQFTRAEILDGLEASANDEALVVIGDLENWLSGVEGATRFFGTILAQRQYSEQGLRQMLRDIVANNSEIYGSAIALNPKYTDKPGGFAPYYYRHDGTIRYADLASEEANYLEQPWFKEPIAAGRGAWTEPYFDTGGGEVNMTTFSLPVYRADPAGQADLYAVVTADVSLRDLQKLLEQLHVGENSYSLLFSRRGTMMSTRSQKSVMQHFSALSNKNVAEDEWRRMFEQALKGEVISGEVPCPEVDSRCTILMGSLRTTGWPLAVVVDQREVLAPLYNYKLKTFLISAATLVLFGIAVYVVTSRQTRPLAELTRATEGLARGITDAPLPVAEGEDEVARLVRSFSAMSQDLKNYIADLEAATASRSRLEGELAAARDIQMSMLPGSGEVLTEEDGVQLWAKVQPAKSVGGDLYTFYRRADLLFFAVGDVSDKGVPAALFMARAISLIQQLSGTSTPPDQAMAAINNALERGNHNCMFVTLFLGVLDITSGELRFASAGHNAPSLLREGVVSEVPQQTGPALGLAADQHYPLNTTRLREGDRLAIFTDGIDEAFNEAREMYGVERFNRALEDSAGLTLADAGVALFTAVEQHAGARPQSDDITLLLLRYGETPDCEWTASFELGPGLTGRVHAWLEPLLAGQAVAPETVMEINLVAEEIVTNVAKYSGLAPADRVQLKLSCRDGVLALESRDTGEPFDPLAPGYRSTLGQDSETAEIGGLGVHLVVQLSDRQEYQRDGDYNVLRVEKRLPHGDA